MNRRHVAVLTTCSLIVLLSVHNARDARADTAGGALTDASAASTQSQARMRYLTAGDNHTCIVLSDNSVKCFGMICFPVLHPTGNEAMSMETTLFLLIAMVQSILSTKGVTVTTMTKKCLTRRV